MDHQYFSTHGEHLADRAAAWERINRNYFGDLGVDALDDGPVDAELSAFNVGPLRMLRICAPPHRVHRERICSELPMDALYKLVLQLKGHAEIRQGERSFHLHPGDWSLYDPRVPYSVTNFERLDLLVVQVPRELLRGFKVPSLHTCEATASSVVGLYAVLSSFLRSLSEQLPGLPNGVGQPLSETVIGLLASTLAAYQGEASEHTTLPSVLRARVKQYVHAHLAESDLSIERIALAMRCSKRYLHRVFEDENCSLDRYIWQTRLERCHADLSAPGRKMISEVAFAWGFNSSAHFCRMFKSHFGEAPREFQRRVAAGTAALPLAH